MVSTLIKNGRIVTAVDEYTADILIEDDRVRMIGRDLPAADHTQVHDAQGLLVLPGGVDVHTHLDWDFGAARTVDTFGTGTKAAAFGGTTTVVDFANQTRGERLRRGLENWRRRAELAGTPLYVVHLSAAEALAAVVQARDQGLPVYAETCPHYLFLTVADYDRPGFEGAKYVMTPPLRTSAHQEALWRGLRTDDLQVVSTDHCPFCFNEQPYGLKFSKAQGRNDFSKIPNGAPGVETRLPLIFDGGVRQHGLSLNAFVELTATAPARLFGLFPRKGTIAVGSDADIVLFDPNETWTIRGAEGHSRVDYTMFEGRAVTGRVKKVFLRGQLIVDGPEWLGKEGMGEFLRRGVSGKI